MATLTKAMLDNLHKGCASIRLIAQTNDISAADFSAADQIFTLKDTFSVTQGEPTVNEIKIDQGDKTILTDVDTAEFNMSGDIPVVKQLLMLIILVFGHGVNLFMAGLGSFVHPMRLTFVEFYKNAGFEGGGKKYAPFGKRQ